MKTVFRRSILCIAVIFVIGFMLPEHYRMPYGTTDDYNHQSFWWHPWTRGQQGSPHCGVDIFGKEGAEVHPAVGGVVIYSGWYGDVSGNMIVVLGPKWKLHEYMHLKETNVHFGHMVKHDSVIGLLGKTGNASKTPAHVHYSIVTPFPYFRLYKREYGNGEQPKRYDWMKMFWLNPDEYLRTGYPENL